jgi:ABC-type glycerol-3-phosphate transport system permease component
MRALITKAGKLAKYLVVSVALLVTLGPVLFTVVLSLQSARVEEKYPPDWLFRPTVANYSTALHSGFGAGLVHSVIIDSCATVVALIIALPSAYLLTRASRRRRVGRLMLGYSLGTRVLPGLLVLVPLFIVFRSLGLLNSYVGMVLAYQVLTLPIAFTAMLSFFAEVPEDILEAAACDGAGELTAFRRVALPVARAGVLATGVLSFLFSWTDVFFALVLTGPQTVTAPVEIMSFVKYEGVDWGALAAGSVLLMVPSLIFGVLARKALVRGITAGALNGT